MHINWSHIMKLTPQTEEEFRTLRTPKDMRKRMKSLVDTNEIIKKPWAIADVSGLNELDRMTLIAAHAVMELERLHDVIAMNAGRH